METVLMTIPQMPIESEEEDFGIDLSNTEQVSSIQPEDIELSSEKVVEEKPERTETIDKTETIEEPSEDDFGINMEEYSGSEEAEEADWWDWAKDVAIQPALGMLGAFTWPLDILKMAIIGEGLTDLDELEEAFRKADKPFDRDEYVKTVMEQGEFVPTQEMLENFIEDKTEFSLKPKTKTGKVLNKLFFIRQLTRKAGLGKSLKAGATAVGTTEVAKAAGVPEPVAEFIGDLSGGGFAGVKKKPRVLPQKAVELEKIANKHGLPFWEAMTKDELSTSAKITKTRRAALEKQIQMTSDQAIDKVIKNEMPISKLKANGQNLEVLKDMAYDKASQLASKNPKKLDINPVIKDIDAEISRLKSSALSPSDAKRKAIKVLEKEKNILKKTSPNAQQLIDQTREYNANVKKIYRKAEFSGAEDEIKNAYAFMNESITNTVGSQAGEEVSNAHRAANRFYKQKVNLERTEGLLNQTFKDGYNPKKLNKLLDSKRNGAFLRRDLGEQGVKEIKEIADYGEKAFKATKQYASSNNYKFNIKEWGPLAGFLMTTVKSKAPFLLAAKPMADYVRGWTLTNPAARTAYRDILKDAASGNFKVMPSHFKKLEGLINEDFGSIEDFFKQGMDQLEIFGDED